MSAEAEIRGFYDEQTNTISYLVWDSESREAVIIEPVLDYDPANGTIDTRSCDFSADVLRRRSQNRRQRLRPAVAVHVNIRAGRLPPTEKWDFLSAHPGVGLS